MLDRVAVLAASPVATLLALLLELLLSLGVCKAKEQLDGVAIVVNRVVFSDDTFSNITGVESEGISNEA